MLIVSTFCDWYHTNLLDSISSIYDNHYIKAKRLIIKDFIMNKFNSYKEFIQSELEPVINYLLFSNNDEISSRVEGDYEIVSFDGFDILAICDSGLGEANFIYHVPQLWNAIPKHQQQYIIHADLIVRKLAKPWFDDKTTKKQNSENSTEEIKIPVSDRVMVRLKISNDIVTVSEVLYNENNAWKSFLIIHNIMNKPCIGGSTCFPNHLGMEMNHEIANAQTIAFHAHGCESSHVRRIHDLIAG